MPRIAKQKATGERALRTVSLEARKQQDQAVQAALPRDWGGPGVQMEDVRSAQHIAHGALHMTTLANATRVPSPTFNMSVLRQVSHTCERTYPAPFSPHILTGAHIWNMPTLTLFPLFAAGWSSSIDIICPTRACPLGRRCPWV